MSTIVNSTRKIIVCLILFMFGILITAEAQDRAIVTGRKIYQCNNYHNPTDTFKTALAAVQHYISVDMPEGYKLKEGSIEIFPYGGVTFITTKAGESESSQGGHVSGTTICPDNSSLESGTPESFEGQKCQCDQGYIAVNNKCVLPAKKQDKPAPVKPKKGGKR